MIRPADAFDVQMALKRMTRERVSTRQINGYECQYQIGFSWLLTLDEDELDSLSRETDSPAQFKEAYDKLKHRCLSHPDIPLPDKPSTARGGFGGGR